MNSTTGSIGNFQIQQTVIFKSGSGAPFNGIAPSPASSLGNSFDPEGIVVHPVTGNLVVSDEYGASVYEFTRGGDLVRKYVTPENIKPTTSPGVYNYGPDANSAGRRINRGFEGLAISPDGRYVFAMLQSAMVNEGGANGVFARIVKFDTGTGLAVAQYAYKMKGSSQGRGISALVAINDHEFLVLERNNRGLGSGAELTPQNKKVFKIDLTGAADVGDIVLDNAFAGAAVTCDVGGFSNCLVMNRTAASVLSWQPASPERASSSSQAFSTRTRRAPPIWRATLRQCPSQRRMPCWRPGSGCSAGTRGVRGAAERRVLTALSASALDTPTPLGEPDQTRALEQLPDGRFLAVEDEKATPFSAFSLDAAGRLRITELKTSCLILQQRRALRISNAWRSMDRTFSMRSPRSREPMKGANRGLARSPCGSASNGDRLVDGRVVRGLRKGLTDRHPALARAAAVRDVKNKSGLNIESVDVSPDHQQLLIGFRGPLVDGCAVVARVGSLPDLFEGGEPDVGGKLELLDLDGAGIRSIAFVPWLGA